MEFPYRVYCMENKIKCFIRKNDIQIIRKLEKYGCHICPCCFFDNAQWLSVRTDLKNNLIVHGIGYWDETCSFKPEDALDFFLEENAKSNNPRIDCGENEQMLFDLIRNYIIKNKNEG